MVLESTSRSLQLTSACCCLIIAVQARISGPRMAKCLGTREVLVAVTLANRTKPPNLEWIKLQLMYLRITKFLNTQNIQMGYLGVILIINVNSSTSEWNCCGLPFCVLCLHKNSCYVKRNGDNVWLESHVRDCVPGRRFKSPNIRLHYPIGCVTLSLVRQGI